MWSQSNPQSVRNLLRGPTNSPRNPVLQRSPKRIRNPKSQRRTSDPNFLCDGLPTQHVLHVNHVQFNAHMLTEVNVGIMLFSKCFKKSSACSSNGAFFSKYDTCQLDAVTGSFVCCLSRCRVETMAWDVGIPTHLILEDLLPRIWGMRRPGVEKSWKTSGITLGLNHVRPCTVHTVRKQISTCKL